MRGFLADGARYTSGAERAQVDAALARPAPVNLRISTLQAENDALRAALILVHAAVDGARDAEAKALDERIWAELVESTKRRQFASRLG